MSDRPIKVTFYVAPSNMESLEKVAALLGCTYTDAINRCLQLGAQVFGAAPGTAMTVHDPRHDLAPRELWIKR